MNRPEREDAGILRPYLFFLKAAVMVSCIVPFITLAYNVARRYYGVEASEPGALAVKLGVVVLVTGAACASVLFLPRQFSATIEALAVEQQRYLQSFPPRVMDWAIFMAAAVSLFLELAVIRWQGSIFELFALPTHGGA